MSTVYCEPRMAHFWLGRKKMPPPLQEDKARRCHERRESYEAIIGEPDHPRYVVGVYRNAASKKNDSVARCIEGNGDAVCVSFLDDYWRFYLDYQFHEKQPGKLFLTHAIYREFADGTDELQSAMTLAFQEDGHIYMVRRDKITGTSEEREAVFPTDENWAEYPPFGDYSLLCREERGKAILQKGTS